MTSSICPKCVRGCSAGRCQRQERRIEVYRQPENGVYQQKKVYAAGETLTCESVPGLQAPLEDWFA